MRFTFNGSEYSISFNRKHKEVLRYTGEVVQSTFPYTFVTIEKVTRSEDGKIIISRDVVREASVGVLNGDSFTYEKGRLAALRSVSRTLDYDFKKAVWKAYMTRNRG